MSFLNIKLVQFHLVLGRASRSSRHVLGSLITNTIERIHAHWCLKLGQKLRNLVIFLAGLCVFDLWGVASIVLILVSLELLNLDIFEGVPLVPSCFSSKLSGAFFLNFSRFKGFMSLESSLINQHLIFVWIVCFLCVIGVSPWIIRIHSARTASLLLEMRSFHLRFIVCESLARLLHQIGPRLVLVESEVAIILRIALSKVMLIIDILIGLDLLFLHRVWVESIPARMLLQDLLLVLLHILVIFSSLTHFQVIIKDHLVSLFFEQVQLANLLQLLVSWIRLRTSVGIVLTEQIILLDALPRACLVLKFEALVAGLFGLFLEIQIISPTFLVFQSHFLLLEELKSVLNGLVEGLFVDSAALRQPWSFLCIVVGLSISH